MCTGRNNRPFLEDVATLKHKKKRYADHKPLLAASPAYGNVIYNLNQFFIKLVLHSSKSLDYYKQSLCRIRNVILRIFKKYLKVSFVPICFQHLSWTNLAFLPCLYYVPT